MALGVADEVGHDEEVIHKAHLPDHAHLIGQAVLQLRPAGGIPLLEALPAQLLKIGVPVRLPLGQPELRQVVLAELELHMAQIRDPLGVVDGLGAVTDENRECKGLYHDGIEMCR